MNVSMARAEPGVLNTIDSAIYAVYKCFLCLSLNIVYVIEAQKWNTIKSL